MRYSSVCFDFLLSMKKMYEYFLPLILPANMAQIQHQPSLNSAHFESRFSYLVRRVSMHHQLAFRNATLVSNDTVKLSEIIRLLNLFNILKTVQCNGLHSNSFTRDGMYIAKYQYYAKTGKLIIHFQPSQPPDVAKKQVDTSL